MVLLKTFELRIFWWFLCGITAKNLILKFLNVLVAFRQECSLKIPNSFIK